MAWVPYEQRVNNPNPSSGGTGSFSYADTKVYLSGGQPAYWMQQLWKFDPHTGAVIDNGKRIWVPGIGPQEAIPGQGGGAKLPGKRRYGGGALNPNATTNLGYDPGGPSPNGFVLIRVMKID